MKPKDHKYRYYTEDELISMDRISEYVGDLDLERFKKNYLVVDAVIRNFEILGEAAKHIPEEVRTKYPEIPWKKMYDLRSIITHEYFGIDYEIIWEIAKSDLPKNQADLLKVFEKERLAR